ncbi:hypothetical protein ACFY12_21515 [Streptomyces sp. NPDC001339]|uniref:hypothetical protein n=1 Tax=Streptomyces sp. NPDC001339 TaxID=3364563 RepID=UPI0036A68627
MRKFYRATAVAVVLGSVSFLGTGNAYAGGEGGFCKQHDFNIDILGQIGILNGLLGNLLNGEGSPGAQSSPIGSSMGCNKEDGKKEGH